LLAIAFLVGFDQHHFKLLIDIFNDYWWWIECLFVHFFEEGFQIGVSGVRVLLGHDLIGGVMGLM